MPYISYVEHKFAPKSQALIDRCNTIIADYQAQGFDLTLRQLYYQCVSRDIIPNNQASYKNLGNLVNDARMAGLIDWNRIQDRTRNMLSLSHWSTPGDIIASAAFSFRVNHWRYQKQYIEIWVEKQALESVVAVAANELDIPYFACKGYVSQSEMWSAAMRLKRMAAQSNEVHILHLGDHDPSGIDMTRDIEERLSLFVGRHVDVQRLALNMDQIEQYNPPPNPAKLTDSRIDEYVRRFGDESWELDALEPAVIADLIRDAVKPLQDEKALQRAKDEEKEGQDLLKRTAERWVDVAGFVAGEPDDNAPDDDEDEDDDEDDRKDMDYDDADEADV